MQKKSLQSLADKGRSPKLASENLEVPIKRQRELDVLYSAARSLVGIEIKSASTYHPGFKNALAGFHAKLAPLSRRYVVYNGQSLSFSDGVQALRFDEVAGIFQAPLAPAP